MVDLSKQKPRNLVRLGCQGVIVTILLISLSIFLIRKYVFKHSIPSYYYYGQFNLNYFAVRVNEIKVGFKDDKPFLWVFTYDGKRNYDYRIDVINPVEKKLVKSIPCEQTTSITAGSQISDFEWFGNIFFVGNEVLGLQSRNTGTGELIADGEMLAKKFPELAKGVGKVEKSSKTDNCYTITTKDGLQYLYFPEFDRLITEKDYNRNQESFSKYDAPFDTTSKDVELRYGWALTRKDQNVRQQLYLTKKYLYSLERRFYPSEIQYIEEREQRFDNPNSNASPYEKLRAEQLVMLVPNQVFLEGRIIASNNDHCVVLHNETIEKNAKLVISCVDKKGKVLWSQVSPAFESFERLDPKTPQLSGAVHKNMVVLINNTYQNRAACGLDTQTGKLLWEFIAF